MKKGDTFWSIMSSGLVRGVVMEDARERKWAPASYVVQRDGVPTQEYFDIDGIFATPREAIIDELWRVQESIAEDAARVSKLTALLLEHTIPTPGDREE